MATFNYPPTVITKTTTSSPPGWVNPSPNTLYPSFGTNVVLPDEELEVVSVHVDEEGSVVVTLDNDMTLKLDGFLDNSFCIKVKLLFELILMTKELDEEILAKFSALEAMLKVNQEELALAETRMGLVRGILNERLGLD